jgi:hypothetical protein
MNMNELIKKWVRRAGLELVSLETVDRGHAIVTAKIPRIEHVFHRVTVIPHDGLVAVLYAEGSS